MGTAVWAERTVALATKRICYCSSAAHSILMQLCSVAAHTCHSLHAHRCYCLVACLSCCVGLDTMKIRP